jgi:hypothetical protein
MLCLNYEREWKQQNNFCYCNKSFDASCCCKVNEKTFKNCPMRLDTVYFIIGVEKELYDIVENKGFHHLKKNKFFKKYKLTNEDWNKLYERHMEDVITDLNNYL